MIDGGLPTVELAEWQSQVIPGQVLTAADHRLKESLEAGEEGRLVVEELRAGVRVTARSWVGVVRFERFTVRVAPKLAGDSIGLVRMIEFATGLDALRRSAGVRSLSTDGAGLLDLMALLLAEATERILQGGLLADYLECEEEIAVIRGRLLGDRQLLQRFGRIDRLVCRYDEHEQNIVENQLLAAALAQCATRVTHEGVRARVRRLLAILQEICRIDGFDIEGVRGRLAYHRLNEHYREAHQLAWLLLDGLGTRDLLSGGKTRCFAFLIDMNRLFEMFVLRMVEKLVSAPHTRVRYQRGDRSIILNAVTNKPYARVIPDLLIESTGGAAVARLTLDAKYKLYDERKLSSGDVYQAFLYSYAYGGGHLIPTALLVYPSSTKSSQAVRLRVSSPHSTAAAEILALGISIPAALAEVAADARGPATKALIEAIQYGLGVASRAVA